VALLTSSNNFRRFKLDAALQEKYEVSDISAQTLDKGFPAAIRVSMRTWPHQAIAEAA